MELHTLRYGLASLMALLLDDPEQIVKGQFFRPRFFPFDRTNQLIEVQLEIIDVETSLTETSAISFSFVNGAIKEL